MTSSHVAKPQEGLPIIEVPKSKASDFPSLDDLQSVTPSGSHDHNIVQTGVRKVIKKAQKPKAKHEGYQNIEEEPLIDTTTALSKNSKKTKRLERQQQKRLKKASSKVHNFLELPTELLYEILSHCRPSDVLRLTCLNHVLRDFILEHEASIAKDIMNRRYWVLSRCLPPPRHLSDVDEASQRALFHPRREKMTEVHKKPYQHIKPPNSAKLCTCATCLMAWNNLNVILDLAFFQKHLDSREPIPMIPRGTHPEWNLELIDEHARKVERAMQSPLALAMVCETHLDTITKTLTRQTRRPLQNVKTPLHRHGKPLAPSTIPALQGTTPYVQAIVPYDFDPNSRDASAGDDCFLDRQGRETYELPWHRDNYYNVVAYVPNRKWSKINQRWLYWDHVLNHDRDLEWARKWFLPATETPVAIPA